MNKSNDDDIISMENQAIEFYMMNNFGRRKLKNIIGKCNKLTQKEYMIEW